MKLPPFRVTEAAIEELDRAGGCVRLGLEAGGCCGTAYRFTASPPLARDRVFGCDGARLVVSPAALEVVAGATLDYGARLNPPRYRVIRNPNTPVRCPCNRSFGSTWPGQRLPECRADCPMPWDERSPKLAHSGAASPEEPAESAADAKRLALGLPCRRRP
jgi:iron-sulfur cluster assembly accessory protein